jgi:hypothetical protein
VRYKLQKYVQNPGGPKFKYDDVWGLKLFTNYGIVSFNLWDTAI